MLNASTREPDAASPSGGDPLNEVYRRLVGIHASIAERTSNDPAIVSWAEREIMDVLRYIKSARTAQRNCTDGSGTATV